MSAPPVRAWNEIAVHPRLCVGTVRTAMSKVHDTLRAEMDGLKRDGEWDILGSAPLSVGKSFFSPSSNSFVRPLSRQK